MKRYAAALLVLLGLTALTSLAACGDSDPPAETGPEPLPATTVEGFDGGPDLDLASVRGPAVVNFWAAWCGPCADEMPVLQAFHQAHPGVRVIGIDYLDPQADKARALVRRTGVTYDLYSDLGGDLAGQGPFPSMRGLPFTALVDDQGRVVHGEYVEFTSVDEIEQVVREHLGEEALS